MGDLFLITASIAGSLWLWFAISGNVFSWDLFRAQLPWAGLVFFGWPVWLFFNDLYNLRWAVQVPRVAQALLLGSAALFVGYLLIFFVTSRTPVLAGLAVERGPGVGPRCSASRA